ncbi:MULTISPECIES: HAD family hydrolase [unclassified Streptomyces]|uniref:HAD family hydrolase n=1 Tax=unclassified Streptomyces TaxID=2593676 RepID=UPI00382AB1C2
MPDLTPPAPFEALIFDCDGTLADTLTAHQMSWQQAFSEFGIAMTPEWYQARVALSAEALVADMAQETGRRLTFPDVLARQITSFTELRHLVRGIDPVIAVARAHHGQVPLAVASSGTAQLVAATLEATGVAELFDIVITASDVRNSKPAPDPYLTACARLSVRPEACIAYEDSDGGIQAASAAGLRTIDVRSALRAAGYLPAPRHI